ncbi:protein Shroom isoform X3 [Ochlerotatus camptorhynchus]|uniref:protein Shroom isoform X3 n=1 Tax=Ochlerotatus camptorhynchus TaxID=644619 RepID=UPI0031D16E1A
MSNFAWVTLATNDSYSLGALVVAHSLKRVHTAHQLAVLITPGVSEAMKNKLRTIFNVVEEVNLLDSKDDANLALLKRPELGITFTKLHCWRLTQFEKCVFLDADTLVLRNCDELFEREELSAAPDVGWPDCFNSGVYVYRPSLETFSSLMQYAVTNGSFDGGDQGLLNSYFSDWAQKDIAKHLPFIYNTSSVASYSYLPAFKQFGQNTKILHFIGTAKPWLQNFNSESRQVHIPGGYQHLANFLQYWWDIFCEDVHSRLSADMQQTFSNWIKPSKVSPSNNAYRSSGTGSFYTGDHHDGGGGHFGGGEGTDHNGNSNTSSSAATGAYHPHWEDFVPSYDATIEYVDPWEEFLRRQDEERDRLAREQERLYYQYLDNQRLQEQQQQQHDHQHHHHNHHHHGHDHHDHHGHQQDANVFQNTEQWVDHAHRHDHSGHWDPQPAAPPGTWQPESVRHDGGGGGDGHQHDHHHQHHQQHQEQIAPQSQQQQHQVDHSSGTGGEEVKHDHGGEEVKHDHGGGGSGDSGGSGEQHHQHWQQQQHQQEHHHQEHHQEHQAQGGGDGSGLAGALAHLHLGEPKSVEQETYEEHMRRQCWESGNIDYMGRDSFENIWRRIKQTVSAGPSPIADSSSSSAPVNPRAISPAPPPRHRSSKSRSRSTTPKRDPRDRSPTPQPEDNVPVEKKEVFAGYQQIITTKTQEGKTHTRTKTVYDPSVDDDDTAGYDAVDAPAHVASATIAESRLEPVQPLEPEPKVKPAPPAPKVTPVPPAPKATPPPVPASAPAPVPQPEHKSTPPRASPRPQLEQQVAQESMAGKEPSVEPVKTIRRKRLASPSGIAPTTTSIATQTTSSVKPKSQTTVAPKTATVTKTTVSSTPPLPPTPSPKATPQQPTKTKPAKPSQSLSSSTLTTTAAAATTKRQSLPSPPSPASKPPPPPTTLSSTNGQPKPTKTIDEIETAPLTANDELDIASSAPANPPVPPRRKRESKISRIVQILTSTASSVSSFCFNAVKNVVQTTFNVTVDAMLVFSFFVVCYSLATASSFIES